MVVDCIASKITDLAIENEIKTSEVADRIKKFHETEIDNNNGEPIHDNENNENDGDRLGVLMMRFHGFATLARAQVRDMGRVFGFPDPKNDWRMFDHKGKPVGKPLKVDVQLETPNWV